MIVPNGGKKYEYSGKWISNGFVSGISGSGIWRFLYIMLKLDRAIRKMFQRNSLYSFGKQTRNNPGKETVC